MPPRVSIPLCIVLGLALTIGVGWACAVFAPAIHPLRFEDHTRNGRLQRVATMRRFGIERRTLCVFTERVNAESGAILLDTFADQTLRAGWPMPGLQCANDAWLEIPAGESMLMRTWNGQQQLRGGWPLATHIDARGQNVWRALPLRPVWPGFALNWALYAALLFVPLGLPHVLRTARRRRTGQCTRCGYDLRGGATAASRCPECGARIA